jgi:hypothetical protein
MTELRDKLRSEIMAGGWDLLTEHHGRGALFVVAPDLDLLEVALAVAEDRVDDVRGFVDSGKLVRPAPAQVDPRSGSAPRFQFVIVQPYVLAQQIAS